MSTRAIIALRLPDASVLATYLHFDGYPDHVLPILQSGNVDPEEALELIHGGEIRSLPPRPEMPEYFANSRPIEVLQPTGDLLRLASCLNAKHIYYYGEDLWMHQKV